MDILKCILKIYPDWKGVVWENDYNQIKPHELETRPIPTLEELQSVWDASVKKAVDVETALNQRATAYKPVEEQLDDFWHAMDTGVLPKVEPFYSDNKSVKDAYPI